MTSIRIAVLTSDEAAEVPRRLSEEAAKQDIELKVLSLATNWTKRLNSGSFSHVIARIGPESYVHYESCLHEVNEPHRTAIRHAMRAFNKADSYYILRSFGLPHPKTQILEPARLQKKQVPFVAKKLLGHKGRGVYLAQDEIQRHDVLRHFSNDRELVVQEYIIQAEGRHKRLFVVGDSVVAAMTRSSPPGDFRSNAKGNVGEVYEPTGAECALAVAATRAHGLSYAGVDLIDSDRGALVLEVNPSPGLTIESYAQKNIAQEIIATLRQSIE